jgi:hypothetical protein
MTYGDTNSPFEKLLANPAVSSKKKAQDVKEEAKMKVIVKAHVL